MSARATTLAERFENIVADVIATVGGCSDADWQRTTSEEGWSVSVVAHHIASALGPVNGFVQTIASGAELPAVTREMIDAGNATHASPGSYGRDETLALLRQQGQAIASGLRSLTDEQLDRTGSMPITGEKPISADQLADGGLIGHPTEHLASIKAALGRASA